MTSLRRASSPTVETKMLACSSSRSMLTVVTVTRARRGSFMASSKPETSCSSRSATRFWRRGVGMRLVHPLGGVGFEQVAHLEGVEVLEADAALVALLHVLDVFLLVLERRNLAVELGL